MRCFDTDSHDRKRHPSSHKETSFEMQNTKAALRNPDLSSKQRENVYRFSHQRVDAVTENLTLHSLLLD